VLSHTASERGAGTTAFERVFDEMNVHRPCDTPSTPAVTPRQPPRLPVHGTANYRSSMPPTPDSDVLANPSVVRVVAALRVHGVRGAVRVLPDAARTARAAADALGVDVAQIANSLVFRAHPFDGDIRPLLVLTSGAHRVDTAKLADLVGLDRISTADADFVRGRTGFAIGGVPPLAHLEPPMTVVDVSLSRYETIWAAAGHPHTVFPTSYDELLRLTAGIPAEVT
jgi:prolyl-tRNA editing enzyme YbaK/EbsC (Cys-tRNA(Pro) deacylase)